MAEFLETLIGYVEDYWVRFLTGAALMVVGWFVGRRKASSDWEKKEFLHRLNISLNVVRDGILRIRTIAEKSCADVFLNDVATEAIVAAAHKTTATDPILPLPQEDYWYYLNAILNEVAEKFAEGQLRRDMGLPVETAQYLICLTCECDGAMRTRKVRAILVRRELLEALPPAPPKFESPSHSTRWQTLNQLAKAWKSEPYKFLSIELCLTT